MYLWITQIKWITAKIALSKAKVMSAELPTRWRLIGIAFWCACWPTNRSHSQSSRQILIALRYQLQICSLTETSVHKLLHGLCAEWLELVSSEASHCFQAAESRHKHYDPVCRSGNHLYLCKREFKCIIRCCCWRLYTHRTQLHIQLESSAITDKLCNAVVQYATVWLNPSSNHSPHPTFVTRPN